MELARFIRQGASVSGFTRLELVLVVSCILVVAALGLPELIRVQRKALRTQCSSNLKVIGAAYQSWLIDFEDHFPWRVSGRNGGSNGRGMAAEHYQVMSNYLKECKILICPTMGYYRTVGSSLAALGDMNVSYAIGVDARVHGPPTGLSSAVPLSILGTDNDIENGKSERTSGVCPRAGSIKVDRFDGKYGQDLTYTANWSKTNHVDAGVMVLEDGSVFSVDGQTLRRLLSTSQDIGDSSHVLKPSP